MLKKVLLASLLLVATNAQAIETATQETAKSVVAGILGGYSSLQAHRAYAGKTGAKLVEMQVAALEAKKAHPVQPVEEVKEGDKVTVAAVKEVKLTEAQIAENIKIDKQIEALNASDLAKVTDATKVGFTDVAPLYAPSAAINTVASVSRAAAVVLLAKKALGVIKAEDKKEAAKSAFDPRVSKANKGFAATFAVAVASGVADAVYGRSFKAEQV